MRILGALALWLATAGVASADVSLGLAKDNAWNSGEHIARMESHGLTDHGTIYYTLMSAENRANPFDWVRLNYLDADIPLVMTLIIDDRSDPSVTTIGTSEGTDVSAGVPGLLERVVSGEFDPAMQELAAEIAEDGRPIVIRPFHEIDGGWYQWGMYASGNSCDLAAQAVNHVIDVFDAAGADNASWEINVNRRDGRQRVFGAAECFIPQVEDRIDAWSVSTYDRCGTSDNYPDARSFADDFRPIYDRLAALSRHPINVAEVSTSGLCGPGRIKWFEEMLEDLEQFPRTEMVTFFFGVVPVGRASNDVPIYWGFDQQPELIPTFRDLIVGEQEAAVIERPVPRVIPEPAPPRFPDPQEDPEPVDRVAGGTCLSVLCFDSAPWSFWGSLDHRFLETPNDAINPLSGNAYGESGTVLRWSLRQRGLWDVDSRTQWGPGLQFSGAQSTNHEQYWNNNLFLGGTLGVYSDFDRGDVISWGGVSAELYLGYEQFTVDAPPRYGSDGGHTVGGIRIIINTGGDWAN